MGDSLRQANNIFSLRVAPLDAHIGRQIAARRTDLGLTRTQLATALHLPPPSIAAYEGGRQHIGPEELFRLAQTLGVSLAFFYAEPACLPQKRQIYAECPADNRAAQRTLRVVGGDSSAGQPISVFERLAELDDDPTSIR